MVSVNGHDLDCDFRSDGRGNKRERVPGAEIEDAKKGECEVREFEGEELGGEARAEDGTLGPGGGQSLSVVRVQVR